MTGILYIVATPIGNLEDITLRALRVLRESDWIACEDTRQTGKLLQHFGISKRIVSYHEHNEAARAKELVEKLESGGAGALVSDAGTPLISDPGYRLVEAAIAAGITVVPIPGPSAVVTALSASGLATDAFRFCGFLPPKSSQRRKVLEELKTEACTLVFYETPHRILGALEDLTTVLGARRIVVGRELTKLHEEFLRGSAAEIAAQLGSRPSVKGEITLLIEKYSVEKRGSAEEDLPHTVAAPTSRDTDGTPALPPLLDAVRAAEKNGLSRMDAIKRVARERGLSKREVYREVVGEG